MIDSGTLLQDRYLIQNAIGRGGMGAVYRAVDKKFGSLVAVKETFYGDAAHLAEAFEREARLLNGLHHPILPHVSDYFAENGGHFLVMEYIEGDDLSDLLKLGQVFPVDMIVEWTLDLLDGLDYLHSQNPPVIHRDIKPNNLKLTSRGKLVLLDFGMAKETSPNRLDAKSVFGYSRRYSPLEQVEGSGTDERSDIFSLGGTVYHLLTGEPPVDVIARAAAIVAGKPDPFVPAGIAKPDVPDPIAEVLDIALALNPENRFQSAQDMSRAFQAATTREGAVSADTGVQTDEVSESALPAVSDAQFYAPVLGIPEVLQSVRSAVEEPEVLQGYSGDALESASPAVAEGEASEISPPVWVPVNETWEVPTDRGQRVDSPARPVVLNEEDLDVPLREISKAAPAFSARGEFRRRIGKSLPSSVSSMRIRRPAGRQYAVLLPILLVCLGLVLLGTYRGLERFRGSGTSNEKQQVVNSTDPAPATDTPAAETSTAVEDEPQNETEEPEVTENEITEPEIAPSEIARSPNQKRPASESPPATDPLELRKGPITTRRDRTSESSKTDTKLAKGTSDAPRPTTRSSRPRRAATGERPRRVDTFEQPSVSSIEAIMTGMPTTQPRLTPDDVFIDDELRRRRIRQIMRQNRRRAIPY